MSNQRYFCKYFLSTNFIAFLTRLVLYFPGRRKLYDFLDESRRSFGERDENSATMRGIAYQVSLSLKAENNKEL